MARVNLFDFTDSISNESVTTADDKEVKVNAKEDLPNQVQEDTDRVEVDRDVSAEATNTKTTEPGPKDGGGDGTADFQAAEKTKIDMDITDVDPKVAHDQNGGAHVDKLPGKVNAKDGLSASDVSTSVESHPEEAELETIETGGAECVPEADDMVMDLDGDEFEAVGLTDAADKGISEADAAIAKVNDLNKAVASVERYVQMLDRMDQVGRVLSPELRQTISWGLEQIDGTLFIQERVALEAFDPSSRVSLEANDLVATGRSGTIDDGEDPAEVSKGLKGKLKKLWHAAVRMFWRAVNAVTDAYHGLVGNMPKIRDTITELRSKVNVLEGGVTFQLKGTHRLMVGSEFVGDSREAINHVSKTANELLVTWPNQLGKLIKEWKSGRPGFLSGFNGKTDEGNFAKLVDNLGELIDRAFRGMQSLNPSDRNKVPSGFLDCKRVHWSGPLPGNRALYTGVNDAGNAGDQSHIARAVKINFSAIPDESTHTAATDVTTPSAGEAIAILRELEKLTHFIDDARKGMNEIKELGNGAKQDGLDDFFQGAMTGNDAKVMAGLMMINIAHATVESQNQFFGYMTALIKAYIGYLSACLKAEASGNTIDGEATRVA